MQLTLFNTNTSRYTQNIINKLSAEGIVQSNYTKQKAIDKLERCVGYHLLLKELEENEMMIIAGLYKDETFLNNSL